MTPHDFRKQAHAYLTSTPTPTGENMTKPTPKEQAILDEQTRALAPEDIAPIAWGVGYDARKLREFASFSSAHGERAKDIIKGLLTIVRVPNVEDVAIVKRASEFLSELEGRLQRSSHEH